MATGKCSERCNIVSFRDEVGYMWNLKNDTNEPIYEAETDSQT